ncbi:ComEC family competence protein [Candidatus Peregrinibacteria bacterium]|nr:ComEC family competence protein [Candidatus Peregrinibacteria bacterium]
MGRSFYTIFTIIGFLAGVLLYRLGSPPVFLCAGVALGCFGLFFLSRRKFYGLGFLFIVFFCLGLLRAQMSEHRVTPDQVDYYNGQKMEFVGLVTEADIRRDKAKYTVRVEGLVVGLVERQVGGNILISLPKYPQYQYGDKIRVKGELLAPGKIDDFDYGNYLSRYSIYSVMYRPRVTVLQTGQGSLFWKAMYALQETFMSRINRLFPEPQASFEAGLLVGARKGIPPELMEKFNITGLTHIIAISGYNIAIIIAAVMWCLKSFPRKTAFFIAIAAIILFTLFVGASPSVVRASIMGILGLIALNCGRQNNIHITILFTAFFMVLWNPKILWWDVGFQLSFAAVLGLMYVSPLFKKYAEKLPETLGIREAIVMTMSAQVMALPIIIYSFERLSLIAPLANLLVAFAIPPAMMFGFAAVAVSLFLPPVGLLIAYIAWGILTYIIKIIEILAAVPYASVDIGGARLWMIFGYYVFLALALYSFSIRRKESAKGGM